MIEGFRKGYIQFGITIGLLSSIVLAIWLWPLHHHDIVSDNNNTISLATKNKNPAKSNTTPNNTNHPNYYEHQDLKAQEAMAEATEAIVFWTKVSLTIGAISISGIFWTLYETRRQVAETRNQTNIMREEHRPWLRVSPDATIALKYNAELKIVFPLYKVMVQNVGKSPAVNIVFKFQLDTFKGGKIHEGLTEFETKLANETVSRGITHTAFPEDSPLSLSDPRYSNALVSPSDQFSEGRIIFGVAYKAIGGDTIYTTSGYRFVGDHSNRKTKFHELNNTKMTEIALSTLGENWHFKEFKIRDLKGEAN